MRKRQMILGATALALTAGVFSAPAASAQGGPSGIRFAPDRGRNGQAVAVEADCVPDSKNALLTSEAFEPTRLTIRFVPPNQTVFLGIGAVKADVKPGKYAVTVNCTLFSLNTTFEVLPPTTTKPPTPPTTSTKP